MRRRRDPFARESYVPHVQKIGECDWCGSRDRVYSVTIESDGGRETTLRGLFCSWSCAEAYHDRKIA